MVGMGCMEAFRGRLLDALSKQLPLPVVRFPPHIKETSVFGGILSVPTR
jgi:hypothetical protein